MKILFIGDIFGRPGRDLVRHGLEPLVAETGAEFVVANVENAAGGFGITREVGDAILNDARLSGRVLRVTGSAGGEGSFKVRDFFVVRGDTLYRIIYFCEVCNITTYSPGNCLCCQQPTVPVEVSPTDPRIYHEEIKGPPTPELEN